MIDGTEDKGGAFFTPLEPSKEGRPMTHHRLDPKSYFVSARSFVATYYLIPGDGEFTFIGSSAGNEGFMIPAYDAFKLRTGVDASSDVIGNLVLNYINVKTVGNGVEAVHVNIMAPNGSIPNMLVSKMAAKQALLVSRIAEFMKNK